MNVNQIKWPIKADEAIGLYLNFQIKVIEDLNIEFTGFFSDPIFIVKKYLNNEILESDYNESKVQWWNYIDNKDAIRNFEDENILKARLAICLLSVDKNSIPELGDHLSWFLNVLTYMKFDSKKLIVMMKDYFPSDLHGKTKM